MKMITSTHFGEYSRGSSAATRRLRPSTEKCFSNATLAIAGRYPKTLDRLDDEVLMSQRVYAEHHVFLQPRWFRVSADDEVVVIRGLIMAQR